jgi:predicted MPP superfamily phosphohydrolase
VLVDLVTLGGLVLRPWLAQIRSVAAVGAVVLAAAAWIGGLRSPQVVEIELGVAGLGPQDDGLRLVQVSDLHLGTLIGRRWLEGTIERVLMLDPDVIAITGDLIDGDAGAVEQLLPELSRLRAPRGVFAVLGNHEHYAGAERSRALMRSAGYRVLDNQAEELAPGLWVAGVPDPRGAAQTGAQPGADLEATLSAVPRGASVVLLLHSPEGVERAAAAGVDLMLCGHTHGGQIWPFHYLVQRAYPRFAGVQVVNGMTLVISRGAGLWGPPMRLFAPADVVLVTFRTRD